MLDNELFDVVPASPGWRRAIVDTLRRADCVVYLSPLLMRLGIEAAGPLGATAKTVKFNRLGATRRYGASDRIFELSCSDPFKVAILDAAVDVA